MKKIVSLIVAIAAGCVMTINAFAAVGFAGNVTGATIDNNVITCDAASDAGFVFKYVPNMKLASCTLTFDVSELLADGWTISDLGADCTGGSGQALSKTGEGTGTLVYKWTGLSASTLLDANGLSVAQFTATPSASSKIDGVKFTVSRVAKGEDDSRLNKDIDTYTLAKGASKDDSVTVANGDVVTVTYGDDATDRNLEGQTIVKGDLGANTVTKDTKFKVTYNGVTKTFNLWGELGFVGSGALTAEEITIGVAFRNAVSASEVQFEVE